MKGNGRISVKEACQLVQVSDSTLRRMIQTGRLKADRKRVGKRSRVFLERADLLAFFGTQGSVSGPGSGATKQEERSHHGGTTVSPADDGNLIRHLQSELSKREYRIDGLRADLRENREELREARQEIQRLYERIEALNAEMRALLREGWGTRKNGKQQPTAGGISGFLMGLLGGR